MNFFTEEQKAKLLHNGTWENRDQDYAPVVRLYMPGTRCVWLLSEIKQGEPEIAFGLCDLGYPELGCVSIDELASINIDDITVQRDDAFTPEYPLSVYAKAARTHGQITVDKFALLQAKAALKLG